MRTKKKAIAALIHPTADVAPGSAIGAGTRIWQFSVVARGVRIGRGCNVGAHCYIESGVVIGDNATIKNDVALWEGVEVEAGVFIGPNAVFTNDVFPRSPRLPEAAARYGGSKNYIKKTRLEYGATIGAGAMILAGASVGRFSTVGLGAVVVSPVAAHALVVGNPARRVGWVCECGLTLGSRLVCRGCAKTYRRLGAGLARRRT